MVRHDSYDVGELKNTRDGDGVSPLKEWTGEGYSIRDGELVRRVKKATITGVDWTRFTIETSKFASPHSDGTPRVAMSITEEIKNNIPDNWDIDDWWKWAPKRKNNPYVRLYPQTLNEEKALRPSDKRGGRLRFEYPKSVVEERGIKGGEMRNVWIALPKVEMEVEEETIPIVTVDFKAVVTGAYFDSSDKKQASRSFDMEGTKTLEVGVTPPDNVQNESDFWKNIWEDIKDEIFPHEGSILGTTLNHNVGARVNGEWINRLMSRGTTFDGSSRMLGALTGSGLPKNAKWEYWYNKKASTVSSGSELRNKVSSQATEMGVF